MIHFLPKPAKWRSLSDILVQEFSVDEQYVLQAKAHQKESGGLLGEAMVELGLCSHKTIQQALAKQMGLAFVEQTDLSVAADIAEACGFKYLNKRVIAPLSLDENKIVLLMANPSDREAVNDLTSIGEKPIFQAVAPDALIQNMLNSFFEDKAIGHGAETVDHEDDLETLPISDLLEDSSDAPAIRFVNSLLLRASREKASDVHLESERDGATVRFRLDGVLKEIRKIPGRKATAAIVSRLKIMAGLDIAEKRKPQDGRINIKSAGRDVDIRVSTLPTTHGERVVLRLLEKSEKLLSLETLGFSTATTETLKQVANQPHGIFLVTGPTGSGKTTSLYALLQEIDRKERNIITIEDPAEYELEGVGQIQVNAKAGITFASGLRSILRQDPDVVMIGEIRDTETARIAVQAAMTGHLVLSTLHTNDAASALVRMTDIGVEPFLLTSSLRGVLAQRLVRKLCTACRQKSKQAAIPETLSRHLHKKELDVAFEPVGCPECFGTGYRGRTVIHELLQVTDSVRQQFINGGDATAISKTAQSQGMESFSVDAVEKIVQGITSIEEVLRAISAEAANDSV